MITNYTKEDLIQFENEMAEHFNNALIKAPVHLYHGNEEQMISVFRDQNIKQDDEVIN